MQRRLRVLFVGSNRYRVLLIERELLGKYPSSIIVKFESGAAALEELYRAGYDFVVVDGELDSDRFDEFLGFARQIDPKLFLIALVSTRDQVPADAEIEQLADEYVNLDGDFQAEVTRVIGRFAHRRLLEEEAGMTPFPAIEGREVISPSLVAGTLAHEINNPLMAILGSAELLLGDSSALPPDDVDKVRIIQDSAYQIKSTLAELSDIRYPILKETPSGMLIDPSNSENG